jgi:hypothetical protein
VESGIQDPFKNEQTANKFRNNLFGFWNENENKEAPG